MGTILQLLKKKFPIDNFFFHKSYSQEGEDMVYRSFYENRKHYKGFYIDVGAFHPYRFSNTLYFYQSGWRGINIEPTPGAIKIFKLLRKRDINLNIGINTAMGELPFYCFNEPALNSFNKQISENIAAAKRYRIKKIIPVQTMPLSKILDNYLPAGTTIDFLNIDAEGLDLEVLKSNDWNKYIPLFIMIEVRITLEDLAISDVYNYLLARNYQLVAKTSRTSFFKLKQH
ncbi:FkbM family methyltransferase [Pedobacter sp. L105]|uniref:FkbM family methyltransferase n=1 Tax=Pedobacter sp. L105 TaxID=1641871 RepID=UPI00131BC817|nr:FkbM family methyltransferase [Pedobacter sp. L105]